MAGMMISMAQGTTVALLLILLVQAPSVRGQSDLRIEGPLDMPNGLCVNLVLSWSGLGYTCEEYVVQTPDGFLLGVQRMYNGGQGGSTAKKPVFLYHGILSGGDSWLLNEPSNSLPFMLGDAGYDVWIGNTRTTTYSSGHVTYTNQDEGFWNWSLDELAAYDVPSMLGVVSAKTSTTIHYIGYSQGAQSALASFSGGGIMPLVDKVVLIAPASYVSTVNTILTIAADLFIGEELLLIHEYELDPQVDSGALLMVRICDDPRANCTDIVTALAGPNCCINETLRPQYDKHVLGTSTKNAVHLGQQYRTHTFAKYDYGFFQNLQVYNSFYPPVYDMSAIPYVPLLLVHGGTDGLADVQDVNVLLQQLKFTPQVIFLPNYGHIDFLVGPTANVEVYSKVQTFLET